MTVINTLIFIVSCAIKPVSHPKQLIINSVGFLVSGSILALLGLAAEHGRLGFLTGSSIRSQIAGRLWGIAVGSGIALILMMSAGINLAANQPINWTSWLTLIVCANSTIAYFFLVRGWPDSFSWRPRTEPRPPAAV